MRLGAGLATNRDQARQAQHRVDANETDQDDFDDAHDASPVFLSRPLSTADEEKVGEPMKSRCDGRHRLGQLQDIFRIIL